MANKPVTAEIAKSKFMKHYEDAAHSVFYNGRKGGYQYLPGFEPCEPIDVLRGMFPHADSEVLEEAADELRSMASAWVKKGAY
jgi:hypothetical protein